MSDYLNWEELIDRHLRGELSEPEKEHLAELLDSDSSARRDFVQHAQWDTQFAEVLRENCADRSPLNQLKAENSAGAMLAARRPTMMVTKTLLAIATFIIVALTTSLYYQQPTAERPIAKITGLSGTLQWTGDGGRVIHDLSVGTQLPGGTIEGMAPNSWLELTFNDGSVVTISGNSRLTLSDQEQKELRLQEGSIAANVVPQPNGKPMLIHTRSALLEVIGTTFEVEAELASTILNVSEGKVRVKRISDGRTVVVPANYSLIAAADREMSLVRMPESVDRWKSPLHLGPHRTFGEWSPRTDQKDAKLKTIPYTTEQGNTIYTVAMRVSSCDRPPVVLHADSRIRVRGHITSKHRVFFGVTLRKANGDFAGRFQTISLADEFEGGQEFEVVLKLRDFHLDPSLTHMKSKLPSVPFDLIVKSIWCHSLYDQVGLAITEVELIAPGEEVND